MEDNRAGEMKQRLAASRERLFRAITGVTEQQFRQRPPVTPEAPQPWCIAEVLAHLLDAERRGAKGIELALREDGAAITWWEEEERLERARIGRASPVPQLIHGLLAARRELERVYDRALTTSGGLKRSLTDSRRGRMTIESIVRERILAHEEEHIAQIEALRVAVGVKALE